MELNLSMEELEFNLSEMFYGDYQRPAMEISLKETERAEYERLVSVFGKFDELELTLKELNQIVPRKRVRTDAYKRLFDWMEKEGKGQIKIIRRK